jgi:hypothetical protein
MTKLTEREEINCKFLQDQGHDYLSQSMREHYSRDHRVFEELKNANVDSLYGPAVTETMTCALKKAIADGDHAVVRSMHSLFLTIDQRSEKVHTPRKSPHSVGIASFGLSVLVLSAIGVLITAFLGL